MTTACGRGHSNAPLKLTAGRTALAVVCLFCPAPGRNSPVRYLDAVHASRSARGRMRGPSRELRAATARYME